MYIDLHVYNDKNICMYTYTEHLKGKHIHTFIDLYHDIYIYMYTYTCTEYRSLKNQILLLAFPFHMSLRNSVKDLNLSRFGDHQRQTFLKKRSQRF